MTWPPPWSLEAKKFREGVNYTDVCEFLSMDLADLLKSDVKSKVESKAHREISRKKGWPARFLDRLSSGVFETQAADATIGKLLCLGREWLFQLVPHVISKVNRVQYGLLTERELGLSENQKDKPSPAAEFAQPDVLIGFTVLAYRYEGMRLSDTVSMLHHLQMKSGRAARQRMRRMNRVLGVLGQRACSLRDGRWDVKGDRRQALQREGREEFGSVELGGQPERRLAEAAQRHHSSSTATEDRFRVDRVASPIASLDGHRGFFAQELLREAVAKKEKKINFSGTRGARGSHAILGH
eukprot:Skav231886  [mRNA]  locus=scaffold708:32820:44430:- [translate_table: standard]